MARLLAILASLLIVAGGFVGASGVVTALGPFLIRHGSSPLFQIVPILVALATGVVVALRSGRTRRIDPGL